MRPLRSLLFCGFLLEVTGFNSLRPISTRTLPQPAVLLSVLRAAAARRNDSGEDPISLDDAGNADSTNEGDQSAPRHISKEEEDAILGYAIDSFLRGDRNLDLPEDRKTFSPPDLAPGEVVFTALRSLRAQDLPSQTHGAALFMRFCLPLRRSERWGDASSIGKDPWKEVLRGALTASTLVRTIRASDFAGLLDWSGMDVTEGAFTSDRDLVGLPSIAYVNAALFFEDDSEPSLFQFKLQRAAGGAWMIDTIRRSQKELFLETDRTGPSSDL